MRTFIVKDIERKIRDPRLDGMVRAIREEVVEEIPEKVKEIHCDGGKVILYNGDILTGIKKVQFRED